MSPQSAIAKCQFVERGAGARAEERGSAGAAEQER